LAEFAQDVLNEIRCAEVSFHYVKAHQKAPDRHGAGNNIADQLAGEARVNARRKK